MLTLLRTSIVGESRFSGMCHKKVNFPPNNSKKCDSSRLLLHNEAIQSRINFQKNKLRDEASDEPAQPLKHPTKSAFKFDYK